MHAINNTIMSFIRGYGNVFIIPPFQRNYEWTTEQCDELFEDIMSLYDNPQKEHYLGNIVYYLGDQYGAGFTEYILVDGQQRITSILLLLCAIRDLHTNPDVSNNLDTYFLKNYDPTIINTLPVRMKQTSHDREVFEDLILRSPLNESQKNSNIYVNYAEFKTLLENKIRENQYNSESFLSQITNSLFRLIVVDVNLQANQNLESIQTIFEKINSTGKPLSQADLIRNFLLLSNNMTNQERLYNSYWSKLENTIGAKNTFDFAKYYLIINTKSSIKDTSVYKAFKGFFAESERQREDVLADMLRISKYYKWLNEECYFDVERNERIDDKIVYRIQEFNALQAKDMYPLYIYLLDKMYYNNRNNLIDIFSVLSDFLIRFRITGRGQGGGAIRGIVTSLLDLIQSDDYDATADNVRLELSRNTGDKKYPNDDEFREALRNSRKYNHTYGRVVLRRIEDQNGALRNIPIPLKLITIEHFMPQKLTTWWEQNLGGTENASRVYDHYLNCIGNLGIMSGPLNATNSNRPWPEKLEIIQVTQFSVTRVAGEQYPNWTEQEIKDRNDKMSDLAINFIPGPMQINRLRIRGDNGEYPASDNETDLAGFKIVSFKFGEKHITCTKWQEFWLYVLEATYQSNNNRFLQMVQSNTIHKSTFDENTPNGRAPIIVQTNNIESLTRSGRIADSDYYYEKNLSSERIRTYAKQVLEYFDMLDQVCYEVKTALEEEDS